MRILLTGSTGFVGQTLHAALTQAGHTVYGGISPRQTPRNALQIPMDFARDTVPDFWLPRLEGMDAVVNAVGVLRDTRARPIEAVHRDTPVALFEACAKAGVQRVVQISALGIDGSATAYARTKRAAEERLWALAAQHKLRPAILRPSVVFGRGGDSSALFMNLAYLPAVLLPGPVLDARVQPVSVHDVAATVVALLGAPQQSACMVECVGPESLTMGQFIASLRQQLGYGSAWVLRMPQWLTSLSARVGDAVPPSPWCSETLAMLGTDNVGDPADLARLLGRPAVHYRQLVATAWR